MTQPWLTEPDYERWESCGFSCLILRNPMKVLLGYVGLPRGHRYFGVSYDDIDVDVHGGLTFSGHRDEHGGEDIWWLGFDCAHAGDLVPDMRMSGTYRDIAYVRAEVERLAAQLAALQ